MSLFFFFFWGYRHWAGGTRRPRWWSGYYLAPFCLADRRGLKIRPPPGPTPEVRWHFDETRPNSVPRPVPWFYSKNAGVTRRHYAKTDSSRTGVLVFARPSDGYFDGYFSDRSPGEGKTGPKKLQPHFSPLNNDCNGPAGNRFADVHARVHLPRTFVDRRVVCRVRTIRFGGDTNVTGAHPWPAAPHTHDDGCVSRDNDPCSGDCGRAIRFFPSLRLRSHTWVGTQKLKKTILKHTRTCRLLGACKKKKKNERKSFCRLLIVVLQPPGAETRRARHIPNDLRIITVKRIGYLTCF